MAKVSIIIPTRHETYQVQGRSILRRTMDDIYEKATGEFETIVVFDGPPYEGLPYYPNFRTIYASESMGVREAVNEGAKVATGKYFFKTDAHCMFAEGFDETLQKTMEDNWIVMPRFYVLDAENWQWQDGRFYDYFHLNCPLTDSRGYRFKAGGHWPERTKERLDVSIDENMKLHGSAWFTSRNFYWDKLGGLSTDSEAGIWGEDLELTLKTWLGPWGGKVMVNKNTWYAHMHRGGQRPREYGFSWREAENSAKWSAHYWMGNEWQDRFHDIEWLVDKFSPVPTWPDNWKELYEQQST